MTLPSIPDESRWAALSLPEQMANIGSEVGRTAKWKEKGNSSLSEGAFIRALDLYDLTIKTGRINRPDRSSLLRELCRSRDLFAGSFLEGNIEAIKTEERYFLRFAAALRSSRQG